MDITKLKENIEKELGLTGLPDAVKNEIVAMLGENCLKRASLAILERLTDGGRAEFEKIAQSGDYEKASKYAAAAIPDFENFIKGEISAEIADFKRRSGVS